MIVTLEWQIMSCVVYVLCMSGRITCNRQSLSQSSNVQLQVSCWCLITYISTSSAWHGVDRNPLTRICLHCLLTLIDLLMPPNELIGFQQFLKVLYVLDLVEFVRLYVSLHGVSIYGQFLSRPSSFSL